VLYYVIIKVRRMSGNSRQRRTANRHWQHLMAFDCHIHSVVAAEIRDWAEKQFKRKNYGYTWAMWSGTHPESGMIITVLALHHTRDYTWASLTI
jgi:hypothetical protein